MQILHKPLGPRLGFQQYARVSHCQFMVALVSGIFVIVFYDTECLSRAEFKQTFFVGYLFDRGRSGLATRYALIDDTKLVLNLDEIQSAFGSPLLLSVLVGYVVRFRHGSVVESCFIRQRQSVKMNVSEHVCVVAI